MPSQQVSEREALRRELSDAYAELEQAKNTIQTLTFGIQEYIDGYKPEVTGGRFDLCRHGEVNYKGCIQCTDEYFQALIKEHPVNNEPDNP